MNTSYLLLKKGFLNMKNKVVSTSTVPPNVFVITSPKTTNAATT